MEDKELVVQELKQGGYHDDDIHLGQLLTARAFHSHYNLTEKVRRCSKCVFHGHMPVTGTGPINSPLMMVAGMPGPHDVSYQTPFIGAEGQLLTFIMAKAGLDRNSVYMTYAVKMATSEFTPPKPSEIQAAREHLNDEIEAIVPQVILTFGDSAMFAIRNKYDLVLDNEVGKSITLDVKTLTGTKKVTVIHTYCPSLLVKPSADQQKYKSAIWQHLHLALDLSKKARPHYVYDRVGIPNLPKKVKS